MSLLSLHDDFFGQFIKKDIRSLHPALRSRFFDCRTVKCPECGHNLLLNPTPDGYLLCEYCTVHWDLIFRSALSDKRIISVLRPDGSFYRRRSTSSNQLDLL